MDDDKKAVPFKIRDEQYRNIFDSINDGMIISDLETGLVIEANPAACKMHGYTREEFIEKPLTIYIHSESQVLFRDVRTFFDTRIMHVKRDGSTFYVEWCVSILNYQGRSCLVGMIREVSKRFQEEHNIRKSKEKRSHEQDMLLEISHTLASTLELQPGLLLDQLREIIEYNNAALFSFDEPNMTTLAVRGTQELEQSVPIQMHLDTPEKIGTLFNGHRPIRIGHIWGKNQHAQFLRLLLGDRTALLLEGMQSWIWVPLAVRGRIIGGIGLAHEMPNYFTAHRADLALSIANQVAITMTNAELYGHAQALAVFEERQRLARNLHDAINQSLFSAGLIAEVLPSLWEKDQQEARRSLQDLRRLTRGSQAEMRALLAELRPATLTDSDFGDLLKLLGDALSGRTNIPVVVTINGEYNLPAAVQIAFYRVCQEALFNIAKHAKASEVNITLRQSDTMIDLQIQDNGLGFDPLQKFSGHYGMSIMRERAEAVGAVLSVTSQPYQGTEVSIQWAIPTKKESL